MTEDEHREQEPEGRRESYLHADPALDQATRPFTPIDVPEEEEPYDELPEYEEESEEEAGDEEDDDGHTPRVLRVLVYLAAVLAAAFGLAYFTWICAGDIFALSKPDREVEVVIQADDTVGDVTEQLQEDGLIRYPWLFQLYCGLTHADEKISAGTYTLNNVYDYHALVNGLRSTALTRATVTVLIPEGYSCKQIFDELEKDGVCTVKDLEETAASYTFDYDFLQGLAYGESNRLEGYLFPDTYEFYVGDDPGRVLNKFLSNFKRKFTDELKEDIDTLNEKQRKKMEENGFSEQEIQENTMDLGKIVIVASLIEKESGGASESSTISSVIYNRLSSKLYPLLEIDASVRYGLDKWTEDLTAEDLATDTPYNTRKNPGLPVGPISNPGLDSIRAALFPRDTDYYFYVLTDSGFHHFSENYYEHQKFIEEMETSGN
ncbi:MAG: endolytic transglycosylase MltG [Oscillospiraceae bacterium]|nr:endolytic transglycosylase MltG [Oscillospiraceae bacterium]